MCLAWDACNLETRPFQTLPRHGMRTTRPWKRHDDMPHTLWLPRECWALHLYSLMTAVCINQNSTFGMAAHIKYTKLAKLPGNVETSGRPSDCQYLIYTSLRSSAWGKVFWQGLPHTLLALLEGQLNPQKRVLQVCMLLSGITAFKILSIRITLTLNRIHLCWSPIPGLSPVTGLVVLTRQTKLSWRQLWDKKQTFYLNKITVQHSAQDCDCLPSRKNLKALPAFLKSRGSYLWPIVLAPAEKTYWKQTQMLRRCSSKTGMMASRSFNKHQADLPFCFSTLSCPALPWRTPVPFLGRGCRSGRSVLFYLEMPHSQLSAEPVK